MTSRPEQPGAPKPSADSSAPLDVYLDGLMPEKERRAFEQSLGGDARSGSDLQLQRKIDASIQRLFSIPNKLTVEALTTPDADGQPPADAAPVAKLRPAAASRSPWFKRLAVAAMLLGGLYGAWSSWNYFSGPTDPFSDEPIGPLTFEQVYRSKAKRFEPLWVCKTDKEFAETLANRLGQPLVLRRPSGDASIETVGWDYCNTLSSRTTVLLARVEGKNALVFFDRLEHDKPTALASGCGLHLHRRELASLVMYELSPFSEPRLLESLTVPD